MRLTAFTVKKSRQKRSWQSIKKTSKFLKDQTPSLTTKKRTNSQNDLSLKRKSRNLRKRKFKLPKETRKLLLRCQKLNRSLRYHKLTAQKSRSYSIRKILEFAIKLKNSDKTAKKLTNPCRECKILLEI